jgi:hypothetical protein
LATRETVIQYGNLLEDCLPLGFIEFVGLEVNAVIKWVSLHACPPVNLMERQTQLVSKANLIDVDTTSLCLYL